MTQDIICKFALVIALTLSFAGFVGAVSIDNLSITDKLSVDLSMRESIMIHVMNNSEGEFKLMLPEGAYAVIVNGADFENLSVSEEIACEDCSAEISFSFPGIVINDSGNYTFYRKIDFPINVSVLDYTIVLPENHSLLNMRDLSTSIFPAPSAIIDNRTFEWSFSQPVFPKEFGVRYSVDIPASEKWEINYLSIFTIAVITFFVLTIVSVTMIFIKKRK